MLKINKMEVEDKGICDLNTGIIYIPKTQNQIAKELGISKNYLSNILNGKRGCNSKLMERILTYYPDLKFVILNPRWKVEKVGDE